MFAGFADKMLKLRTRISPVVTGGIPRRERETRDRFDRLRGFASYLRLCQQRLKRPVRDITTPLHRDGIEIIPFLTPEKARAFRQEAYEKARGFSVRGANKQRNRLYLQIDDEDFFGRLFEEIFSEEVDARIVRHFGSEYVPYWYVMQETKPGAKPGNSFLWHCDKGPSTWLKILLYFTSTRDTGGNTLVLSKEDTRRVAATDYIFRKSRERTSEIAELERRCGRRLTVIEPELEPGEGILFEPRHLLHRGQVPDKAPRVILQLLILPSPLPWREAWSRLRKAPLPERERLVFPSHARKLARILGCG